MSADETPKFCKDCAHFQPKTDVFGSDHCDVPYPDPLNLVTGEPAWPRICWVERSHENSDSCGRAAKWWKLREQAHG